ncbi:predicted protein [Coccidioides posadasii str. Silveira]|uniref:Predicted protein n=1 Tax=Coccidioides posadasii (strain RMSCC 757 / Silveira) TaxID=443226 RepID=E9DGF6_COCPS|nr:predicted protein [Coccidioides posadasii str. Silveira]
MAKAFKTGLSLLGTKHRIPKEFAIRESNIETRYQPAKLDMPRKMREKLFLKTK